MEMKARRTDLKKVFPLMGVRKGCVVSKRGDFTIGYELTLPVAHTLNESEYDDMVLSFASALKIMPHWTLVHRQDRYLYETFEQPLPGTYLKDAYLRHHNGRRYLVHHQYLYFTMTSKTSALRPSTSSSIFGNIRFFAKLPPRKDVYAFGAKVEEFISIITASGRISARKLTQEDMVGNGADYGLIQDALMLGQKGPLLSDIITPPDMVRVGDNYAQAFEIAESEVLPGEVETTTMVESLSRTGVSSVYLSYASPLGMQLECEHFVNQYIFLPPQEMILQEEDKKRKKMVSGASFAENRVNAEEIGTFIDDVHKDNLTSVLTHFNVIAWGPGDEDSQELLRGKVSAALTVMKTIATRDINDVPVLYFSQLPGAGCELGKDNLMTMEQRGAFCLGNYETFDRGMEGGLFQITDRTRHVPITIDLQSRAQSLKLIDNLNVFLLGPSGSGKSFFCNYYFRQCYDAGEHVFIIDQGGSYEGLCEIINEMSYGHDGHYHTWDKKHPMRFNPFVGYNDKDEPWLDAKGNLNGDNQGVNFFLSFICTVWQPKGGWTTEIMPILHQIIVDFIKDYDAKGSKELPVFDEFYRFLGENVQPRIVPEYDERGQIRKMPEQPYYIAYNPVTLDQFDIVGFLRSLSQYSLDGKYGFFLNDRHPRDIFNSRFTVFDVDKLANGDDKLFYSLCVLCIMNAFDNKMRNLRGQFKVMALDEAWSAIANETMAPYLKCLWKTCRKYTTSAMVITQQLSDIVSSEVIKDAILKNSDVKILLDQSGNMNSFDELVTLMGLSEKEKNMILSMGLVSHPEYNYRECFIKLTNKWSGVFATEASEEEGLAYESDKGKKKPVYDLAKELGSIREAIDELVRRKREKKIR